MKTKTDDVIARHELALTDLRNKLAGAEYRRDKMGPVVRADGSPRRGMVAEHMARTTEIEALRELVAEAEAALARAASDLPRRDKERAAATAAESEARLLGEQAHALRVQLEKVERDIAACRERAARHRGTASLTATEIEARAEAERNAREAEERSARIRRQIGASAKRAAR
jgi:hypothetical protein